MTASDTAMLRVADSGGATLRVAVGQHASAGRKPVQQDFHGACVPTGLQLATKGVAAAVADGISSSDVSHIAAQFAVTSFLEDYYCTSDAWSVKTAVERVLNATNGWLFAQTQQGQGRFDKDRGHVCTLSALVIKSQTAHLFHIGDSRIYQVHRQGGAVSLEQLTQDHRVQVASHTSYLARAMGMTGVLEIDHRSLPLAVGDTFLLTTDGVHEHLRPAMVAAALHEHADDLDTAAERIVNDALACGSDDNLTLQILRIDALPAAQADEWREQRADLPVPPPLQPRQSFDGYTVQRTLHSSSRSHVYLATDDDTGTVVVLKTPATDLQADPGWRDRFLLEEWVARRIDSPHVLKPVVPARTRQYLYVATEPVEGGTLAQWMRDHPRPALDEVRPLISQIAKGLRAFHRQEMLHHDLRPENIMIDHTGTVKIIDFGAVSVAGLAERAPRRDDHPLGSVQYTAPECLLGDPGSPRSDLYGLGVLTYQLLSGGLPYGLHAARVRGLADLHKLHYDSLRVLRPDVPSWVDGAIRRATHPQAPQRQEDPAEFVHDLLHPNPELMQRRRPPLMERRPVAVWQGLCVVLLITVLVLLATR